MTFRKPTKSFRNAERNTVQTILLNPTLFSRRQPYAMGPRKQTPFESDKQIYSIANKLNSLLLSNSDNVSACYCLDIRDGISQQSLMLGRLHRGTYTMDFGCAKGYYSFDKHWPIHRCFKSAFNKTEE